MALKKKITKKPEPKADKKNYAAAYKWLVMALNWRGKCADLLEEANKKL